MMAFGCEQFPVSTQSTLSALVIYLPIKITGWNTHKWHKPIRTQCDFWCTGGCVRAALEVTRIAHYLPRHFRVPPIEAFSQPCGSLEMMDHFFLDLQGLQVADTRLFQILRGEHRFPGSQAWWLASGMEQGSSWFGVLFPFSHLLDALNSYDGAIGLLTPIEAYVHGNMKLLRTMCWSLVFGEYWSYISSHSRLILVLSCLGIDGDEPHSA